MVHVAPGSPLSRIATLDPADEAADMDAAGKQALVLPGTRLRFLLILRPLDHEAFQARNVKHAAGQRRRFDALEIAADVVALGVKRAKPGGLRHAAAALFDDFARQPIVQYTSSKVPRDPILAEHGFGDGEREFEQAAVSERATSRDAGDFGL